MEDPDLTTRDLVDLTDLLAAELSAVSRGVVRLLPVWNDVVGPQLAPHAVPTALVDGVLSIRCSSAVWASEIQLLGPTIIERLRPRLGVGTPSRIRCTTGRLTAPPPPDPSPPAPPPPPLSPAAAAQVEATVTALPEGDLRDSVRRAMEAAARRTHGR